MKELKIVFTKSKKPFPIASWLIRMWTRKPYSHVAREVVRRDWGAGYYQASEGKVNYEHENIFYKKHKKIKSYTMQVDAQLELDIRQACWKESGNDYGMLQNLGIAVVDIVKFMFSKDIKNPWKKGRNCSELLYLTVFKKIDPSLNYNPDTIKPHHIEDILQKLGYEED